VAEGAKLVVDGRGQVPITAIQSGEWVRATTPPPHAVLVNQAASALGIRLRPWQEAVAEYCRLELVQTGSAAR
jgi:dTDP-4-dehydrorhamnose reductase